MGKKKFVDKKKSATFTLVFRDTAAADGDASVPVRQFTRVDGGDSYVPGFTEDDPRLQPGGHEEEDDEYYEEEEESLSGGEGLPFDDADESEDEREKRVAAQAKGKGPKATVGNTRVKRGLPENLRRDLIELGFPDDGYDYNQHMRVIASTGPGAAFVPSTRAADPLHADIRAYDASKVDVQAVSEVEEAAASEVIEHVSSSTRPVRKPLSKDGVLDVDIIAALENSDGSQFDSADELEDEFVIVASVADEEGQTSLPHENTTTSRVRRGEGGNQKQRHDEASDTEELYDNDEGNDQLGDFPGQTHIERPIRLLDEQFETLALNEYDDYDDEDLDDDDPCARGPGDISQFSSILSEFLDDKDIYSEKYETIAESHRDRDAHRSTDTDNVRGKTANTNMVVNVGVEEIVLKKTLELGEHVSEGEELVLVEIESEDDRDSWDCESVVSMLSNLDNLPGKIRAPAKSKVRRPKLQDVEKAGIIRLGGKQRLPVDYLPRRGDEDKQGGKPVSKEVPSSGKVGGPRAGETSAEKKARKALVKENKREARVARKTLRLCYKDESQKAQQGAATMGPKVIHIP